jgi:hypothetical protein
MAFDRVIGSGFFCSDGWWIFASRRGGFIHPLQFFKQAKK